ncbi:MAG: protein-disulfide reductase DsbD domain-containing protein [Phycisphaerales bacterium]
MPIFPLLACLSIAATPTAPAATVPADESPAQATLHADRSAIWPGGTINLAVNFKIQKGWHLYWRGQNDSGFSPGIDWTLPAGCKVGEIRWPAPHRHIAPGDLLDHIYEGDLTLIVPFTADKTVKPGTPLAIAGAAKWLVCKEACLPGDATLSLALPVVAAETEAKASPSAAKIAAAQKLIPQPAPATVVAKVDGSTLILNAPGAESITFLPDEAGAFVVKPLVSCTAKGDTLRIPLDLDRRGDKQPTAAIGILEAKFPAAKTADATKPEAAKPSDPGKTPESTPRTVAYSINVPLRARAPAEPGATKP